MKFIFKCADCKKRVKSWTAMLHHLLANPDHAPEGYACVEIYPEEGWNIL